MDSRHRWPPPLGIPPAWRRTPLKRIKEVQWTYVAGAVIVDTVVCFWSRVARPLFRGVPRQWRGMPAGGASINQKTPIINTYFLVPSLLYIPPALRRTPLKRGCAARDDTIYILNTINFKQLLISPRFLDFRRRRRVENFPASRNLEILGKSIIEESVLF